MSKVSATTAVMSSNEQVGTLRVRFKRYDGEEKPVYQYRIEDGDNELLEEGDDLRGGAREAVDARKAIDSLVSFLGAEADRYEHSLRTGRDPDDGFMFAEQTRMWAYEHSDALQLLALEFDGGKEQGWDM